MHKLPIYCLVDVSESMVGTPIEQVQDIMYDYVKRMRTDPYFTETVWVSVMAYNCGIKVLVFHP